MLMGDLTQDDPDQQIAASCETNPIQLATAHCLSRNEPKFNSPLVTRTRNSKKTGPEALSGLIGVRRE
jgi:hypothetical protein